MGTRNLQTVISREGEIKVNQYCQWDGYPSGQGLDILQFLRTADIDKYSDNVSKLRWITKEEGDIIDSLDDWNLICPQFSRDMGSRIHKAIEIESVKVVQNASKDAKSWCEGFYTIDLKNNTYTSEYGGQAVVVALNNLPTDEEYLQRFEQNDGYQTNNSKLLPLPKHSVSTLQQNIGTVPNRLRTVYRSAMGRTTR